jgi:copper chaperone
MIEMKLPAMSCGHCERAVRQACAKVDPTAKVEVDLNTKLVRIDSSKPPADFARELEEAGYPAAA